MVQTLWQRLKFLGIYVKNQGQGHKVIDLGVIWTGWVHAKYEVSISYG